jgi:hypothetical protein
VYVSSPQYGGVYTTLINISTVPHTLTSLIVKPWDAVTKDTPSQHTITFMTCDSYECGWLAECPQCYCGEIQQMFAFLSIFVTRKLIIDLIIRYVSLNIIEKIIPKPNIFTETQTQGSLRVCNLCSCNLLAETNKILKGSDYSAL